MSGPQTQQSPGPAGLVAQPLSKETNAIVADADGSRKRIASFKAAFALGGFAVHELAGGGFLVCRWNLSKHCPDLGALAGFAKQVGVRG